MLMPVQPPLSGGIRNNPTVNVGSVSNKGFEMALTYNDHKGDFKYSVTATLAHDKNEIVSLAAGSETLPTGAGGGGTSVSYSKIGYELYSFWLVKTDGIFRSQAEIDNYTWTNPATGAVNKIQPLAKVGDQKYVDANNDGKIGDGLSIDSQGNPGKGTGDRQYCGSPFPQYEYGLRLEGSWKFIDVSLYFQGVTGNKIYNSWAYQTTRGGNRVNNFSTELLDSYSFNPNSMSHALDIMILTIPGWDGMNDGWKMALI